jgi:hypothetical protein
VIAFFFMGLIVLAIEILKTYHKRKKRRSPFTEKFLRGPGQSLIEKLNDINAELVGYLGSMIAVPLAVYAGIISDLYFQNKMLSSSSVFLYTAFGIVFTGYLLVKIVRLLNLRRATRLGFEGEVATGQELNQMMLQGYHVFHDFVADKFNIDHVVVGPAGVFAVEAKVRTKPVSDNKAVGAKVTYDGRCLHFPQWKEVKPLEQAKSQAIWLEKWLSSATGEKTLVRPVVALPGWYVTRTSPEGIPVINEKQFKGIAKPTNGNILDNRRIKSIVYQIEQKCRNTESKAAEGLN